MSAFPVNLLGHTRADERDTVVVTLKLHRLQPAACAYPSIALKAAKGYDVRAASNGDWVYWWNGAELMALELNSVTDYLQRVVHKGSVPAVVRHVVSKRKG